MILKKICLCRYTFPCNSIPTMTIDWKANSPIKAFIAYRQNRRKPTRVTDCKSNCRTGISSNANIEPVTQAPLAGWEPVSQRSRIESNRGVERRVHDVEGTLEMQKMLLQKLAEQENAVKGLVCKWPKRPLGGQRITSSRWEFLPESSAAISKAELEQWKRDMTQALQMVWNGT